MIITVWPFPTRKRMTVFTVHEPPSPPLDRLDRADDMVFLKDGFVWSAFFFGPLWLLANRLWLAAAGYIAVAVLAYFLLDAAGVVEQLFGPFLIALNATVGFEAHWLKAVKLESSGWNTLGSVSGRNLADCERRFFEGWLPSQPLLRREAPAAAAARATAPQATSPQMMTPGLSPMAGTPGDKKKRGRFAFFTRNRNG